MASSVMCRMTQYFDNPKQFNPSRFDPDKERYTDTLHIIIYTHLLTISSALAMCMLVIYDLDTFVFTIMLLSDQVHLFSFPLVLATEGALDIILLL